MKTIHITSQDELPDVAEAVIEALGRRTVVALRGEMGAGKTTLIRKLISEAFKGEKLVLIENEFGKIAIDGGFLQDAGIEITEMSQGCICCSLVGDFGKALRSGAGDLPPGPHFDRAVRRRQAERCDPCRAEPAHGRRYAE